MALVLTQVHKPGKGVPAFLAGSVHRAVPHQQVDTLLLSLFLINSPSAFHQRNINHTDVRVYQVITPFSALIISSPAGTNSQSKCHKRCFRRADESLHPPGIVGAVQLLAPGALHTTAWRLLCGAGSSPWSSASPPGLRPDTAVHRVL